MKKLILLIVVLIVGLLKALWTGEFIKCVENLPWAVGYFNRRFL